jgi:hypothetical protein
MSLSLLLVPLATAVITSAISGAAGVIYACEQAQDGKSEKIATRFNSEKLLKKTLMEHGTPIRAVSSDSILADFGAGKILYERSSVGNPYTMRLLDVKDMDDVICSVKAIEHEYGSNIQSYTYNRIKSRLPDDMHLQSEEVLDDDSILITLTID